MEYITKRIYEPASPDDGFRVLVDRLWPRGIKREDAAIDLWAKELAPSHELRKWFSHTPERFTEFARRYRKQLASRPQEIATIISAARDCARITLLYAAKDTTCNHAIVLEKWLQRMQTT